MLSGHKMSHILAFSWRNIVTNIAFIILELFGTKIRHHLSPKIGLHKKFRFFSQKNKNFIVTLFPTKKRNLEHYRHKHFLQKFSKTFFDFSFLDIFKMSIFKNHPDFLKNFCYFCVWLKITWYILIIIFTAFLLS